MIINNTALVVEGNRTLCRQFNWINYAILVAVVFLEYEPHEPLEVGLLMYSISYYILVMYTCIHINFAE